MISLCFCLDSSAVDLGRGDALEKEYINVYKPLGKFLYSHPSFRMTFAFNGVQIDFFEHKHPEFLQILQTLLTRKQIEILGGGYYDPIFPMLFPRDRTDQIEKLSFALREKTGKRPRGIKICESIWDSSLVACFKMCGMEYVFLDETLFAENKNKFVPFFMSERGKTIRILPIENSLKPTNQVQVVYFLDAIFSKITRTQKKEDLKIQQSPKIVSIHFSHEEFHSLLASKWLDNLEKLLSSNETKFLLDLPSAYLKKTNCTVPIFLPSGISMKIAQWTSTPFKQEKKSKEFPTTIFDFLQNYPQSAALYDRMLYLGILANQTKGDKSRRLVARERLLESQNGNSFICTTNGIFENSLYRQKSFKNLIEVEKILRECEEFLESVVAMDYNSDGLNEYVFRMNDYFAVVNLTGGAIRELDVMHGGGNYADSLSRVDDFDGCSDDYARGLFVDHIFTDDELNGYLKNQPSGSGIFAKMTYSEIKLSSSHKTLELYVEAIYKKTQKISLKKKYVATSSGMMVQYIIKNESNKKLRANFVVESSFAQTNFSVSNFNAYKLEIITSGEKQEVDTRSSSRHLNNSGKLKNVEGFLLTDIDNSSSFMFEPNEKCGLSFVPIIFKRPSYSNGEIISASMTFSNALFWDVDLEPGMEMERAINFSIFTMHKKRRNTKK